MVKKKKYMIEDIEISVTKKKIKNMILRVKEDESVTVSVPYGVNDEVIETFVSERLTWIREKQDYIKRKAHDRANYISGEKIHILGKLKILEVHFSDKEKGELKEDRIILYSKKPLDADYNKALFYSKFNQLITNVFQAILSDITQDEVVLKMRLMKKRWGTCFVNQNTIQLNKKLIHAPREYIAYVVHHELVHFDFPHHGATYYEELEKRLPDWKRLRKMLNKEYASYL